MNELNKFKNGQKYLTIVKSVSKNELLTNENVNDEYKALDSCKFVPASGAATRMFTAFYAFLNTSELNESVEHFFTHIEKFAFYSDLKEYISEHKVDVSLVEGKKQVVDFLLNGLNYGNLPKALLKFHLEGEKVNTPIDEHVKEANEYLDKTKEIHFTISNNHEALFNDYTKRFDGIEISYSFQKEETNTLAVDLNNEPFVKGDGEVLYRPGGHGALIANLNEINADMIFIKNIDNVCHDRYLSETVESKKLLASIGYEAKKKVDTFLKAIEDGQCDLEEVKTFIEEYLKIEILADFDLALAKEVLDKPLRVCGVVKNLGEPGGGPYVVQDEKYTSYQICEKAELDLTKAEIVEMLEQSSYFNPVDLVCFVKNYKGEKYDLMNYVNEDRYFISTKSFEGRELKALELPGLWNGAMHNWNTLFVEVPLATFNPVKTVNDLLREKHQG
jgi:hypothetical protein